MSAAAPNITEHEVENFIQAFSSGSQYEKFLDDMGLDDDFDIETLTTQYNLAIQDFKSSEEGNQYAHLPYEIQLAGIPSFLENRDRFERINYPLAIFFYNCCLSTSYNF